MTHAAPTSNRIRSPFVAQILLRQLELAAMELKDRPGTTIACEAVLSPGAQAYCFSARLSVSDGQEAAGIWTPSFELCARKIESWKSKLAH